MSQYIIITNNSSVFESYPEAMFLDGELYLKVLEVSRDYIHQGHRLITHPLAGSVKPNQNPYRTVIISKESNTLDFNSLSIIEDAITITKKMIKDKKLPNWNKEIREDFKFVDKSHIDSAILSFK